MDPVFNERKLRAWLEPLSRRARTAFVLSCVERMLPSLDALHSERGGDLPAIVGEVVETAWSFLRGGDPPPDLAALTDRYQQLPPVDELPGSIHAGPATNAAFAITSLLETLRTGSLDKAIEAAAVAADSAESYAAAELGLSADAPDLDARIAAHPLVQQELKRQRDDIRLLRRASLDLPEGVAAIRRAWAKRATATRTP